MSGYDKRALRRTMLSARRLKVHGPQRLNALTQSRLGGLTNGVFVTAALARLAGIHH